jgi:hypothetical protein
VTRKFYIYICQADYGNNAVDGGKYLEEKWEWPGESPEGAVQGLQDRYPWYQGDLFIVVETADGDVSREVTAVRVDQDGVASKEYIGR